MAKKKYKKRQHSPTVAAKRQLEQEKLATEKARSGKRMNPLARTMLLTDLVFLAIVAILDGMERISDSVSLVCSIIGFVLMLAALWVQFGPKDKDFGKRP